MFFQQELLSKRNGPLAKVWLASHMGDRKLSKAQLLGTSIPKSVGTIMGQDLVPMALRLSGQLLLGVARIYSRKAKYLMDDCNDALLKIKMTFRPGATAAVDMTAEQANVAKGAITRQEQLNDFDMLYQDADMDFWQQEAYPPSSTPARAVAIADDADITRFDDDFEMELPRVEFGDDVFGGVGDFDLGMGDAFGLDGIAGQKRPRDEDDISVELGRDLNSSARKSARMSLGLGAAADDDTFDQTFGMEYGGGGEGYGNEVDFEPIPMGSDPFRGVNGAGDFDLTGVLDGQPEADGVRSAWSLPFRLCCCSFEGSASCWFARCRSRGHAKDGSSRQRYCSAELGSKAQSRSTRQARQADRRLGHRARRVSRRSSRRRWQPVARRR